MRWIAPFFLLALTACSLHTTPGHQANTAHETALSADNGFFKGPDNAEWLATQAPPQPEPHFFTTLTPEEKKPLLPRLFPTHYDWPYWVYSAGFANTMRYK